MTDQNNYYDINTYLDSDNKQTINSNNNLEFHNDFSEFNHLFDNYNEKPYSSNFEECNESVINNLNHYMKQNKKLRKHIYSIHQLVFNEIINDNKINKKSNKQSFIIKLKKEINNFKY